MQSVKATNYTYSKKMQLFSTQIYAISQFLLLKLAIIVIVEALEAEVRLQRQQPMQKSPTSPAQQATQQAQERELVVGV